MTNEKYKNKYRIKSTRLQNWDYGSNGTYFITICTLNRVHYFGDVMGGNMELLPIGHIANSCWYDIPNHFPFVELGWHIIMPNHVHGIVVINKSHDEFPVVETQNIASPQTTPQTVETQNIASLQPNKNQFGPQSKNLASIIRGFKIGVTKNARQINPDFAWQPRYYDHIVRNENEYQRIAQYIIDNPKKWDMDTLNGGEGNKVMETPVQYNDEAWMI